MDTEMKLCLLLVVFSRPEFAAAQRSSVPDLPKDLLKGLEEILSGKYLNGLLNLLQFQSTNAWTPDLLMRVVAYLASQGETSFNSIQASVENYLDELSDDPKFLLSELRKLDSLQFQQVMKYFLQGQKEHFNAAGAVLDFDIIRERIFQLPGGNRTMFLVTLEKCLPSLGSAECVEILSQVVRMYGASYLQMEVIATLPLELPEDPFRNLSSVFRDLYDRISANARRALYEWMTQILQNTHMSNAEINGSSSWVTAENLWILGRYMVHLPLEEIRKINVNEIRMFISYDNATKQLDTVYDITPDLAKAFLELINASGFDMRNISTIYRLGLLVCFYNDSQDLDATVAKALLHQMMKCNQLRGYRADVHKLKSQLLRTAMLNQTLNESIGSLSDAVVGLTLSQLESLSPEAVQGAILTLQQVSGWTKSQIMVLTSKYLHSEKVLTFSNISQLGELVSGISAQSFHEMSPRELLIALKGGLSQQASELSPAQQDAILSKVLSPGGFQTAVSDMNGALFKEVSLSHLMIQGDVDVTALKEKEMRRSQALLLFQQLSHKTSLVDLISTGQLVKGITCEQIDSMSKPTFLNHYKLLEKSIPLLSSYQMEGLILSAIHVLSYLKSLSRGLDIWVTQLINCLAWKYWKVSQATIPPILLAALPSEYFTLYTSLSCGYLLTSLRTTDIEYLMFNKKEIMINKVNECLNGSVSDVYQLDLLGNLICHLSPNIIQSGIAKDVMATALNQFKACTNLSHEQNVEIKYKLLEYYGDPLNWTLETVQDMAPFWNLLSREEFMSVLEKFQNTVLQMVSEAPGIQLSDPMLLVLFHSIRLLSANVSAPDRSAECEGVSVPSANDILKLGEANAFWSPVELQCVDALTITRNIHALGAIKGFNQSQLSVLKEKAKQVWGALSEWKSYHLTALGRIATALSEAEIEELNLSSIDVVSSLGQQTEWNDVQAKAIFSGFLNDSSKSISDLKSYELTALAGSLCAADPEQILQIRTSEFSAALSRIGSIPCNMKILHTFKRKTEMIFGKAERWTRYIINDVGYITAALNKEDFKSLRPDLMPYIPAAAVSLIPDDVFKELSPEQIASLGPENAAMVTGSQASELDPSQLQSLRQALDGIRANTHKPEPLTTQSATTASPPPVSDNCPLSAGYHVWSTAVSVISCTLLSLI